VKAFNIFLDETILKSTQKVIEKNLSTPSFYGSGESATGTENT
jgi:hypothetical protein